MSKSACQTRHLPVVVAISSWTPPESTSTSSTKSNHFPKAPGRQPDASDQLGTNASDVADREQDPARCDRPPRLSRRGFPYEQSVAGQGGGEHRHRRHEIQTRRLPQQGCQQAAEKLCQPCAAGGSGPTHKTQSHTPAITWALCCSPLAPHQPAVARDQEPPRLLLVVHHP